VCDALSRYGQLPLVPSHILDAIMVSEGCTTHVDTHILCAMGIPTIHHVPCVCTQQGGGAGVGWGGLRTHKVGEFCPRALPEILEGLQSGV